MGRFYFGQIVEVYFNDGRGKTKGRPAIILSGDEECDAGGPLLFLMISTSPTEPCPHYHVKLHDGDAKDPITGLCRSCWAKCNVVREMEPRRIIRSWGHVPDDLMDGIADIYDRLCEDDDFDDWQ